MVTDFHLLKSPLVVFGFGLQAFVCGFSRQNINSVYVGWYFLIIGILELWTLRDNFVIEFMDQKSNLSVFRNDDQLFDL